MLCCLAAPLPYQLVCSLPAHDALVHTHLRMRAALCRHACPPVSRTWGLDACRKRCIRQLCGSIARHTVCGTAPRLLVSAPGAVFLWDDAAVEVHTSELQADAAYVVLAHGTSHPMLRVCACSGRSPKQAHAESACVSAAGSLVRACRRLLSIARGAAKASFFTLGKRACTYSLDAFRALPLLLRDAPIRLRVLVSVQRRECALGCCLLILFARFCPS